MAAGCLQVLRGRDQNILQFEAGHTEEQTQQTPCKTPANNMLSRSAPPYTLSNPKLLPGPLLTLDFYQLHPLNGESTPAIAEAQTQRN